MSLPLIQQVCPLSSVWRVSPPLLPLLSPRTEAREELRRQVGTLRFDLNTLASAKSSKDEKKKALALRKDFITSVSGASSSASPQQQPNSTGCVH